MSITLQGFIDFVKAKPADERYNYWSDNCAFAQYVNAAQPDNKVEMAGVKNMRFANGDWIELSDLHPGLAGAISDNESWEQRRDVDWTFGALATRLEALE